MLAPYFIKDQIIHDRLSFHVWRADPTRLICWPGPLLSVTVLTTLANRSRRRSRTRPRKCIDHLPHELLILEDEDEQEHECVSVSNK